MGRGRRARYAVGPWGHGTDSASLRGRSSCGSAPTLLRVGAGFALGLVIAAPAVARYRREAMTDPLTGLLNRRGLSLRSGRALPASGSGGRLSAEGFLMLDLVGFKQVNERYGYEAGDRFLVEFARRLRARAPRGACVGRLGGDEFAVVAARGSARSGTRREVAEAAGAAGDWSRLLAGLRQDLQGMSLALTDGVLAGPRVDVAAVYPA